MAETKKIHAKVKMVIMGGTATPAPPVGSSLGQHGVNMMDFINPFNEATQDRKGKPTPVLVTIYEDKSMTFVIKGTPTAELIRQAVGIKKGSGVPNKDKVATLSQAKLEEIAKEKIDDLNANDVEAAKKVIAGTARSMGVEVETK
ncbi:50S ribosomal protein L11 [Candidatus Saccharibacteria bacterium]|nr:50S ribosomal protein L11 [Candidatus Saccharibacteria bacterium]